MLFWKMENDLYYFSKENGIDLHYSTVLFVTGTVCHSTLHHSFGLFTTSLDGAPQHSLGQFTTKLKQFTTKEITYYMNNEFWLLEVVEVKSRTNSIDHNKMSIFANYINNRDVWRIINKKCCFNVISFLFYCYHLYQHLYMQIHV